MKRLALVFLILFLPFPLLANTLSSQTDRVRMGEDETLNLTITYDESSITSQPDLKGLQSNFEIIGTSSSSNTSIINGSISSTKTWRYTLMPKHSGKLLIPSFELKGVFSDAIEIEVVSGGSAQPSLGDNKGDLFIESSVDKKKAYVQEMITLTMKIYTSVNINRPKLDELNIPGFMVEKLSQSEFETQYNGRTYYVLQYQYALFATQSGAAIIPKNRYQISQIISNGPRSMFNVPGFESTQARFVSTPEFQLEILPPPDKRPAPYWLVAEDVQIEDNLKDNQTLEQGAPLTRTISLTALNALSSHLPPLPETSIKNIKAYPEPPVLNNNLAANKINARRIENSAIVPIQTGTYTLPEIKINWWNSKSKQFSVSTLPARTLTVIPSANTATVPPEQNSIAENTPLKAQSATTTSSIEKPLFESHNSTAAPSTNDINPQYSNNSHANKWYLNPLLWIGISIILLVACILFVFLLVRAQKTRSTSTYNKNFSPSNSGKEAFKSIKKACLQNNSTLARQEIIQWARLQWPDGSINSLLQVIEKINEKEFTGLVQELDASLYKKNKGWDGEKLLAYLNAGGLDTKTKESHASLAGLYD